MLWYRKVNRRDNYQLQARSHSTTFNEESPERIQVRRRIRAIRSWSESSLGAFWITKDAKFLNADIEDSNQTAQM